MTFRRSLVVLLLLLVLPACTPVVVSNIRPPSAVPLTASSPSIAAQPTSSPTSTLTPPPALTPSPSSSPSAAPLKVLPASATSQDETIHVARDISYAQISGVDPHLLSLDVYYTDPLTAQRPVLLFIHGGGWAGGDKSHIGFKPDFFTHAGFVFVSANYRLSPQAIFPAHVQDVAKAIAWTVKSIRQYGGDPNRLFLMGHSAGAHLVTLVATDDQYLKSFGLSLTAVKGVIALDSAAFDLADFASLCKNHVLPSPYSIPFGQDPAVWKFASPSTYVSSGKHIPPIAVIYSGDVGVGSTVSRQILSADFDKKLVAAGVPNVLIGAPDKTHASINDDFGKPGDPVAQKTLAFLKKILTGQ